MTENKYAVKTDLTKLLNLLDELLQDEEVRAKRELVAMSEPAFPHLLVFAEGARKSLETVIEQRLEVALLKWMVEREAEAEEESANTSGSSKNPSWQVISVTHDTKRKPLW